LSLGELLEQRLARVELEREGGLADSHRCSLLAHLLALEVALQRIEEETVVRHTVPVEDLLLLLRTDAVVLVQKVEEGAFRLFQRSVSARLEVSQIREDALFKLLRVLDRATKSLEAERQASYNVGTGDVEEVAPRYSMSNHGATRTISEQTRTRARKRRIRLWVAGSV
jgi:hypothetical protein